MFHWSRFRNLRGFAVDVAKSLKAIQHTAKSAISRLRLGVSWKSRKLGASPGIRRKRLPKKRQRIASTRRRGLLGIPRSNRHGSPNRRFRRKFSQHLRKPQRRPLQSGLEYRAGTRVGFAKATARIHGTGWRWRNSWASHIRTHEEIG